METLFSFCYSYWGAHQVMSTHANKHACIHVSKHIIICTYEHTCMHACMHTHTQTHTYTQKHREERDMSTKLNNELIWMSNELNTKVLKKMPFNICFQIPLLPWVTCLGALRRQGGVGRGVLLCIICENNFKILAASVPLIPYLFLWHIFVADSRAPLSFLWSTTPVLPTGHHCMLTQGQHYASSGAPTDAYTGYHSTLCPGHHLTHSGHH